MNKKNILIIITIIALICIFSIFKLIDNKNSKNSITTTTVNLTQMEGIWKPISAVNKEGNEVDLTEVLGSVIKEGIPELNLKSDSTFTNYIGKNADEDETPTYGNYIVYQDEIVLIYHNNEQETLKYNKDKNIITMTISDYEITLTK